MTVEVTATLRTDASPADLDRVVADLARYPEWLDIVAAAAPAPAAEGDPGPAWLVDLRGQIGPLRRSKRLRMVRSRYRPGVEVRFERREIDGRQHSPWTLDCTIVTDGPATTLTMGLHYGGTLWVPLLDRLLRDEIERSKVRLGALVDRA